MASTKLKTFKLLEILFQETDANNRLKTSELIDRLAAQGIPCDRRSVYDDIELFRELGIDVRKEVGYYINERKFSLEEIKYLTDAISASDFLPKPVAERLEKKLIGELSKSDGEVVDEQFFADYGNDKHKSGQTLRTVRELSLAIHNRKCVEIKTTKNNVVHYISPYSLLINNQNYYLIGYNNKLKTIFHFRLDRISDIKLSRLAYVSNHSDNKRIDTSDYRIHTYNMYSGELTEVTINFHAGIFEDMQKHFDDVGFQPVGSGMFKCNINVNLSDGFYRFVLGYGNQIRIVEPKEVADELKRQALEIAKTYE